MHSDVPFAIPRHHLQLKSHHLVNLLHSTGCLTLSSLGSLMVTFPFNRTIHFQRHCGLASSRRFDSSNTSFTHPDISSATPFTLHPGYGRARTMLFVRRRGRGISNPSAPSAPKSFQPPCQHYGLQLKMSHRSLSLKNIHTYIQTHTHDLSPFSIAHWTPASRLRRSEQLNNEIF